MATKRLYYRDSYTTQFNANVVDTAEQGRRLYLDRTFFYPTSGGQPNDTGRIGESQVLDVVDEGDRIAHLVADPVSLGSIMAEIDWSRRFDHMQQHSGQHLLSAVFVELFGFSTLSFHLGQHVSTIELATKSLSEEQIDAVEDRANEMIRSAVPITVAFEEATEAQQLRKASERAGTLRIVEIQGADRSACGGTHVRTAAEIGPIQIRGTERIRGNVRIEFVCGARATRRARSDFRVLSSLAKSSATPIDKLPEYIGSIRKRLTTAEKESERLVEELARNRGNELYQHALMAPNGIRRMLLREPAIVSSTNALASAFISNPKAMLLVVAEELPALLFACSIDTGIDAGKLLSPKLAERGGRGGGSATVAQGKLPDREAVEALVEALGFGSYSDNANA